MKQHQSNFYSKLILTFSGVLILISISVAQEKTPKPIIKNNEKVTIDGNTFNIHKVEQGQTLYGICKVYNCTVEQLLQYNPSLNEGLKAGMELKIPVLSKKENKSFTLDQSGKFLIHEVEKKQTLYAISKKYNVSVDDIVAANPEIAQGLKEGQQIKIPQKEIKIIEEPKKVVVIENVIATKTSAADEKSFSINLFLPFYLKQNDSIINKENLEDTDELYNRSIPGIEYYSGFKLACDSLSHAGINTSINVYDTPIDSATVFSFFAKNNFKQAQLWVGPFHSEGANAAAQAAKGSSIPIVIPYSQQNKLLLGNEFAIKLTPSLSTEMETMAHTLVAKNAKANFIIVHNGLAKEKTMVQLLKKKLNAILVNDSAHQVIYKNTGSKGFISQLSTMRDNVIIITSNDQAFVTDFINKTKGLDEKQYKLTIIGMENWINYDNLDINTIQKLNLTIPSNNYVDYADTATNKFIKNYRLQFQTDPGKYAFAGYDAAMYFITHFKNNGTVNQLVDKKQVGLSTSFNFKKTAVESGFENQSLYLLKYQDYELKWNK